MKIDHQTLEKIAHLARLELNESKKEQLIKDMEEILNWVEKLNEVDTDGVEPLTNMSFEVNAFREDVKGVPLDRAKALQSAPKHDDEYFRVPKVLD